ncbi:hypothetical protein PENANT_c005G07253 [Penicillium antarcticum]|uniref:Homeobox domain-containing protein n=1 Tax=Penicillium antarcticum TaxID=416450 RepID=A0A1V6QEZ1_9EURO|nr:uncharacterized protein N7508_007748 [Penicillium antarcticum]KAJ5297499.1 hypothetical protein N7508_007748 [Penicillium antarcticum]OQD87547.1 hypothetical protein PENANT_c005G07253 [Penicillium antarcticum]
MNPQQLIDSSTWPPLPHSVEESGLESILPTAEQDHWQPNDPAFDPNAFNDFYLHPSDPSDLEWAQWISHESPISDRQFEHQDHGEPRLSGGLTDGVSPLPANWTGQFLPQQNLNNVSQWLDGAYRPAVPCSHCRRHKLQCLIIRTTEANPNPKTSCSSCVALFRECSLAKGEKRFPAGFETMTPVLGHLHGVPEDGNISSAIHLNKTDGGDRREPKQFIRKGARVLREWFYQNQEHPYPTDAQKNQLSTDTGFSQKRISTWFANARRRQKQKIQSSGLASRSRTRAGSPMITSTLPAMTPMERWQASPPEDEPVPEAAIQNAIASGSDLIESDGTIDPFKLDSSAMDFLNFDESSSHLASSVSSIGSRASETSDSGSSAWSYHSSGDTGLPFPLLPKQSKPRRIKERSQGASENNIYQCTFCIRSFKKKHDWTRHEKSVHLTLDAWICTPNLNDLQQSFDLNPSECPVCDVVYPLPAHMEEHEFHICTEKPVAERLFSRKDYLWQHLRKFHSCTKMPVSNLDVWSGSGGNVESSCGFCGCRLSSWTARADHLAEHFKNRSRMFQWEGEWGLDSMAMGVLRNAILPSERALNSPT